MPLEECNETKCGEVERSASGLKWIDKELMRKGTARWWSEVAPTPVKWVGVPRKGLSSSCRQQSAVAASDALATIACWWLPMYFMCMCMCVRLFYCTSLPLKEHSNRTTGAAALHSYEAALKARTRRSRCRRCCCNHQFWCCNYRCQPALTSVRVIAKR